jgi:hypothetical protein
MHRRLVTLKKVLEFYLSDRWTPTHPLSVLYLYFDGYVKPEQPTPIPFYASS